MIPAIQTKVDGRNYRSLLEAKWATFFTIHGWQFEYEPFETNGWIPDFLIKGKHQNTLVEVKPFSRKEEWIGTVDKIFNGLWGHPYFGSEVLLLGVSPTEDDYHDCVHLGFLAELGWYSGPESIGQDGYFLCEAPLTFYDGEPGFTSMEMSYTDRISGIYKGGNIDFFPRELASMVWANACNKVQWNRTDK